MPLQIVRQDITKIRVDAIVNPTDANCSHAGGVDAMIHKAAGAALDQACADHAPLSVEDAIITSAFDLPCKHVIHTVGPVWEDGKRNEDTLLRSCYTSCLGLAVQVKCKTIAFPLISSGVYGYPKDQALKIAMDVISSFLLENEMTVYIVVFDKEAYRISEKLFSDIVEYIDDHYVDEHIDYRRDCDRMSYPMATRPRRRKADSDFLELCDSKEMSMTDDLETKLKNIDESFSQMLLRKIDEKGMTDAQCYKKANIDRKLFSKIRSDVNYKPSKPTVLAFAISLELSLDETEDMLRKAGFALSHSHKFDVIIEYFISRGNYNIFEINEALFAFDQSLLGA